MSVCVLDKELNLATCHLSQSTICLSLSVLLNSPLLFLFTSHILSLLSASFFHHYQRGHRPPTIPYCFCISFLRSSHVDTLTRITVARCGVGKKS